MIYNINENYYLDTTSNQIENVSEINDHIPNCGFDLITHNDQIPNCGFDFITHKDETSSLNQEIINCQVFDNNQIEGIIEPVEIIIDKVQFTDNIKLVLTDKVWKYDEARNPIFYIEIIKNNDLDENKIYMSGCLSQYNEEENLYKFDFVFKDKIDQISYFKGFNVLNVEFSKMSTMLDDFYSNDSIVEKTTMNMLLFFEEKYKDVTIISPR
jgi:hypothetical protein